MCSTRRTLEARIHARKFSLEDFAGLSIGQAAELIRHEPVEHAVIYTPAGRLLYYVASRPESPLKVTVPLWKSGLIRGNVFVHNHPGSESFSQDDLLVLLRHGAREVHAYGPERSFRMVATKSMRRFSYSEDSVARAMVSAAYRKEVEASAPQFQRFVRARMLTDAEAWVALTHSVMRRMALHFRFAYQEI